MSDKPIYMLNVIWYKPDGGTERYAEYLKAAGPVSAKHGAKRVGAWAPQQAVIGELDADLVFVIEWPNQAVFEEFVNDPEYQAVRHLREEAISNSLLIRCNAAG